MPELTQALLLRGVDLNARDRERRTPVVHAILQGDSELALQLAHLKADLSLEDGERKTAVVHAIEMGLPGVCLNLLHRGAPMDALDNEQRTPAKYSQLRATPSIVFVEGERSFSEYERGKDGKTALVYAAEKLSVVCPPHPDAHSLSPHPHPARGRC